MKTLGILLIVIGAIMTVFTGFNLITKKEVADVGPIEINKTEKTPIYWSPITGAILLVAGVVIVATSRKGSRV
jgi:drug/metabolite transporter (DMT)-like permease